MMMMEYIAKKKLVGCRMARLWVRYYGTYFMMEFCESIARKIQRLLPMLMIRASKCMYMHVSMPLCKKHAFMHSCI